MNEILAFLNQLNNCRFSSILNYYLRKNYKIKHLNRLLEFDENSHPNLAII